MTDNNFQKWPSTEQFHTVVKGLRKYRHDFDGPVVYRGTVKLHGTNAGVRFNDDGTITAQSRNRSLSVENDNFGFAKFVQEREDILKKIRPDNVAVLFGEFVGKGIQQKVALSQCERHWVIFGAFDSDGNEVPIPQHRLSFANAHGIYWVSQCVREWEVEIDPHGNEEHFAKLAELLTRLTLTVEEECPWAKQMFGVSGVGEGIVWSPLGQHFGDSRLRFKTKGHKHSKSLNKTTKIRSEPLSPEEANVFDRLVAEYLTAERAEQILSECCDGEISMRRTGDFLAGIGRDVKKESVADLEALGLEWKDVSKRLTAKAKDLWFDYICTGEWSL